MSLQVDFFKGIALQVDFFEGSTLATRVSDKNKR
jgi:hypothetical protein